MTEVEATFNSRPLSPFYSTGTEDQLVLMPGHFLIGWPQKAPPGQPVSQTELTFLWRWGLVQCLTQARPMGGLEEIAMCNPSAAGPSGDYKLETSLWETSSHEG